MTCPYLKEERGRKVCTAVDYGGAPRPLTQTEVELCMTRWRGCPDYKARRPLPPLSYGRPEERKAEGGNPRAEFRRASEF